MAIDDPNRTFGDYDDGYTQAATVTSNRYATVFGPTRDKGNFSGWTIGNFGDNINLSSATNTSGYSYATVFGIAYAENYCNLSSWTIGNFGDNAILSSSAINEGRAAIFGAALTLSGSHNFSNWKIGNFGARANLIAHITEHSAGYVVLFGLAEAYYDTGNFSGWTIGNFGPGAKLTVFTDCESTPYAAVFGLAAGRGDVWNSSSIGDFSDWTIGSFGPGSSLTASANGGDTAYATIFGAAHAYDGGNFSRWTIGDFRHGASLTAAVNSTSEGYAAVFGVAEGPSCIANNWTVEFRGDATISTAGTANASLNTLGGTQNENFRFYFNNDPSNDGNATVSIAALKLDTITTTSGQATMTAAADQGNNLTSYARAIALGPNFQLNVGHTRVKESSGTFETEDSKNTGGEPSGNPGTMNIFGAIAKASGNGSAGTAGSILRINSGWTVNAYGPVEDLASIAVNNGTFNAYSAIRNIAIIGGNINAYGISSGIGTITLNGGNLRIARCENTNFDESFNALKSGMRYVGPDGTAYGVGEENTLDLDATVYPWKGTTTGGKLTLNSGNNLVFHMDSSRADPEVAFEDIPSADGKFEFVNGYVAIEDGGTLEFNGGKICLINDAQTSPTLIPAHTDVWLIRTKGTGKIEFRQSAYGGAEPVEVPFASTPGMTRYELPAEIVGTVDGCATLDGDLKVYMFSNDDESNPYGGIYIANPYDVPVTVAPAPFTISLPFAAPQAPATRQANSELAGISAATTSILRATSINSRGSGNGLFAAILGNHFRQSEIDGLGYRVTMKGVALGANHSQPLANTRNSITLGALAGYLSGNIHFSGSAAGQRKIVARKSYHGAVFAAYEDLDKSNLRTNVNLFAGLQHIQNRLSRVNEDGYAFSGKMNASGQFAALEAMKTLCRHETVQVGPWALISYNRICQKSHAEHGNAPDDVGVQTVSPITHNFLDTTIGLNVEKECQRANIQRYISGGFLRCGWQYRALQDHTNAEVQLNGTTLADGPYPATLAYPRRNSFAFTTGLHANLNARWNVIADSHGTLAKNQRTYVLSLALGCNF